MRTSSLQRMFTINQRRSNVPILVTRWKSTLNCPCIKFCLRPRFVVLAWIPSSYAPTTKRPKTNVLKHLSSNSRKSTSSIRRLCPLTSFKNSKRIPGFIVRTIIDPVTIFLFPFGALYFRYLFYLIKKEKEREKKYQNLSYDDRH